MDHLIEKKFGDKNFNFKPARTRGSGTVADPHIIWFFQAGHGINYRNEWLEQTEDILRFVNRYLQQTLIIIRREAHNQRNTYDAMGSIITHSVLGRDGTPREVNTLEFDDWHLTATFGLGKTQLYLQGHVYVLWQGPPNQEGSSIHLMSQPKAQRVHAKAGEHGSESALVLWLCDRTSQRPRANKN